MRVINVQLTRNYFINFICCCCWCIPHTICYCCFDGCDDGIEGGVEAKEAVEKKSVAFINKIS